MVGDRESDVAAGFAAGCVPVLIGSAGFATFAEAVAWILSKDGH
jgi:hypothetical protein